MRISSALDRTLVPMMRLGTYFVERILKAVWLETFSLT